MEVASGDEPKIHYWHVSVVTVIGTYVLMLLGAYTSAVGAGLSCPDWPTCYGVWVPFLQPEIIANSPYTAGQIFVEWAHRGVAMIMGFVILGTAVFAWYRHRDRRIVSWPAVLALVLLPVQVILGGLTVTRSLQPVVVTSHLGVAILIIICLVVSTVAAWSHEQSRI